MTFREKSKVCKNQQLYLYDPDSSGVNMLCLTKNKREEKRIEQEHF